MSGLGVDALETVTVLVREQQPAAGERPQRDRLGNVQLAERQVDVEGCSVQQPSSTEAITADSDRVTNTLTILAPWWPEVDDDALAGVLVRGRRWEVHGSPRRHRHPRLGHVTVILQEVRG